MLGRDYQCDLKPTAGHCKASARPLLQSVLNPRWVHHYVDLLGRRAALHGSHAGKLDIERPVRTGGAQGEKSGVRTCRQAHGKQCATHALENADDDATDSNDGQLVDGANTLCFQKIDEGTSSKCYMSQQDWA